VQICRYFNTLAIHKIFSVRSGQRMNILTAFMATLKPFAALLPEPALASKICELPYDVMSSDEARQMAAGNPLSFLHVSKPEIDLPRDTPLDSPKVYARGLQNFQTLISESALRQDDKPNFYLYRQIMGRHTQTGLVAAASCEEYVSGIIKKHELTRPDKEDDRVRHIETLDSQTGPVFLTYKAVQAMDDFVKKKTAEKPKVDFTANDGVRHTAWKISEPADIRFIEEQFSKIPHLYIADGHHRSAAAARVCNSRKGAGHSGTFLTVIFPHNQMQILPYNRVLKDLNGKTTQQLLEILKGIFAVDANGKPVPAAKHQLSLYLKSRWYALTFQKKYLESKDAIENLDVTLLQKHVLGPVFGIDDPRTSKRISFVGGIRGTNELEKLVDSREFACAFSMFPTGIDDLMEIADAGGIMPPKSTWFEPKLRDAMFCHMI
jgi:uncharacterized protein (DUF1015 family)